jgi:hypothetical protein
MYTPWEVKASLAALRGSLSIGSQLTKFSKYSSLRRKLNV